MPRQVTLSEREQIAQFWNQGLSRAEIARRLGRHPTTIGRELTRNSEGSTYWASSAQQKAAARRNACASTSIPGVLAISPWSDSQWPLSTCGARAPR
jgi:transposase, IS30 family